VIIFPDYDHVGDKYLGAVEGTLRRRGIECLVVTFGDYGKDVRDLLKLHDDNTMKNALLTHVDSEWLEEGVTI